ncbi:hypothetical protein F7725_016690, partial [Dissostichus mawsoni]
MNIVGQFAETVFVTVKELYRGLNPATLTGGIDVIVVRQPDGSFQCSPFHVRFGKLGSQVPAHLCTSPIPLEDPEEMEETPEGASITGSGARRKKRRRKRIRSDTHLREEASSSSEEREREKEWERESDPAGGESPAIDEPLTPLQISNVFYSRSSSPKSDSELLVKPKESSGPQMQWNWGGFPMLCQSERTPVELQHISPSGSSHFRTIERQDSFDMSCEPVISCGRVGSVTVVRPQPRTQSLDLSNHTMQTPPFSLEKNSHMAHSSPTDLSESAKTNVDSAQAIGTTLEEEENRHSPSCLDNQTNGTDSPASKESTISVEHISTDSVTKPNDTQIQLIKESDDCTVTSTSPSSTEVSNPPQQGALSEQSEQGSTGSAPNSEGDSGIDPCAEGGEEDAAGTEGPAGGSLTNITEGLANPSEASSKVEDKKKGKRNHHLGPTGIYLDDLTKLEPEVAALYFPKSETEGASQLGGEQGSCSESQSPQSVGSGAMDSGTEYLSDSTSYNMDVSMSLCGQVGDTSQITKEKFMEHIVTYLDFANNPGIIEDPNLVICINSNYYNWAVAAPMVLSMTTFQKSLPKSAIEQLVKDKMPKKSGRWWFSWRRRQMDDSQQKDSKEEQEEPLATVSSTVKATLDDIDSDEAAGLGRKAMLPAGLSTETLNATQSITQIYRKSLRLTSEQIEHLNLREGANKVVFSVTTQYQGTCRCEAAIYLWNWDDRVIISDIDGTITKSDALGHILPQFGKDWTHKGIAKLYHKNTSINGYKFLYCSARAIGMAAITKDYLQWVNDQGIVLPQGPVLLAPSSLFSALHREVIEKKPEVFKIACLGDIRDLFNPQRQPFYAAFGNRTNDAFAYKQVGVPDTRLFTVNPKGELIQERTKVNKSSYSHLSELVEHFFPMLSIGAARRPLWTVLSTAVAPIGEILCQNWTWMHY